MHRAAGAWGGPAVMNTEEELRAACAESDQGTFPSHGERPHQATRGGCRRGVPPTGAHA